jgi:hypothetical protein
MRHSTATSLADSIWSNSSRFAAASAAEISPVGKPLGKAAGWGLESRRLRSGCRGTGLFYSLQRAIRSRQKPRKIAVCYRSNGHFFTVVGLHKMHFPQPGRRTSSQQPIRAKDKA